VCVSALSKNFRTYEPVFLKLDVAVFLHIVWNTCRQRQLFVEIEQNQQPLIYDYSGFLSAEHRPFCRGGLFLDRRV